MPVASGLYAYCLLTKFAVSPHAARFTLGASRGGLEKICFEKSGRNCAFGRNVTIPCGISIWQTQFDRSTRQVSKVQLAQALLLINTTPRSPYGKTKPLVSKLSFPLSRKLFRNKTKGGVGAGEIAPCKDYGCEMDKRVFSDISGSSQESY